MLAVLTLQAACGLPFALYDPVNKRCNSLQRNLVPLVGKAFSASVKAPDCEAVRAA
jgi:hypothetical protein